LRILGGGGFGLCAAGVSAVPPQPSHIKRKKERRLSTTIEKKKVDEVPLKKSR
jgi:hypothetical protein